MRLVRPTSRRDILERVLDAVDAGVVHLLRRGGIVNSGCFSKLGVEGKEEFVFEIPLGDPVDFPPADAATVDLKPARFILRGRRISMSLSVHVHTCISRS